MMCEIYREYSIQTPIVHTSRICPDYIHSPVVVTLLVAELEWISGVSGSRLQRGGQELAEEVVRGPLVHKQGELGATVLTHELARVMLFPCLWVVTQVACRNKIRKVTPS